MRMHTVIYQDPENSLNDATRLLQVLPYILFSYENMSWGRLPSALVNILGAKASLEQGQHLEISFQRTKARLSFNQLSFFQNYD